MKVWYNEIDPYCIRWLDNLMTAGHIMRGCVSPIDIQRLRIKSPEDAARTRCHFFAGIGGWDYALRLAGWPESAPVWTGSCPCQPFSDAGKRQGANDGKHLWPDWFRLIEECRPPIIFGEQVASAHGRMWLDSVSSDLEALGYDIGSADLCAASVGAPHIRQRLYWVAYSHHTSVGTHLRENVGRGVSLSIQRGGEIDIAHRQAWRSRWDKFKLVACYDPNNNAKIKRPVEPGTYPLVDGIPNRVGRLRAYGNAIVPQVAAMFIRAAMETQD